MRNVTFDQDWGRQARRLEQARSLAQARLLSYRTIRLLGYTERRTTIETPYSPVVISPGLHYKT